MLYVGIAKVEPAETRNLQAAGVAGRLSTYRRARLTSDFAIGVALRFVVPQLSRPQVEELASGTLAVRDVHEMVKQWVGDHISFSADSVPAVVAVSAEATLRRAGLNGAPPSLNPLG